MMNSKNNTYHIFKELLAVDKANDTICFRQNGTNGISIWSETNLTRKGDTLQELTEEKGQRSFPKCSNIVSSDFIPSKESEKRHYALCNVKCNCVLCQHFPTEKEVQNDVRSDSWKSKQDTREKRRVDLWVIKMKVKLEFASYQYMVHAMPSSIVYTGFQCGRKRQYGSKASNAFPERVALEDGDKNANVGEKVEYLTTNDGEQITASVLDTPVMMVQIPGKIHKLYRGS